MRGGERGRKACGGWSCGEKQVGGADKNYSGILLEYFWLWETGISKGKAIKIE